MEQLIKTEKTDVDCDDLADQRKGFSSPELTKSDFEDLWKELNKLKEDLSRERLYYKKLQEKYQSNSLKFKQMHLKTRIMLRTSKPCNTHLGNISQKKIKEHVLRPNGRSVKKSQCAAMEQHGNGFAHAVKQVNPLISSNVEHSEEIREDARKRSVQRYRKDRTVKQVLGMDYSPASRGHLEARACTDLVYDDEAATIRPRSKELYMYVTDGGAKQQHGTARHDSTQVGLLYHKIPKRQRAADFGTKTRTKQLLKGLVIRSDKNMKRLLHGKELEKLLKNPVVKLERVDVNEKYFNVKTSSSDETCGCSPVKIKDKLPDKDMNAARTSSEMTQPTKFYKCIMKTSLEMVITLKLIKELPKDNSNATGKTGSQATVHVSQQTSHNRTRKPRKSSERNGYHVRISTKPFKLRQDSFRKLCGSRKEGRSNSRGLSIKRLGTGSLAKTGSTGQRGQLLRDKSLPATKPNKLTEFTNHTSQTEPLCPQVHRDKKFGKHVAPNMYIKTKQPFSEPFFAADAHATDVVSHSKINSALPEISRVKQEHSQNTVETGETRPQENCPGKSSDGHLIRSNRYSKESVRRRLVLKKNHGRRYLNSSLENRDPRSKVKRRHRCRVCRKCLGTAHELIRHVKQVHQLPFYCRNCRTHFPTNSEYKTHLESRCKGEKSSDVSLAPSSCIYSRSMKEVANVVQAKMTDEEILEEEADENHITGRLSGKELDPLVSSSVEAIGQGLGEAPISVHEVNTCILDPDTGKKKLHAASAEMLCASQSKKIVNGETIRGKDFANNLCLLWIDSLEEQIAAENLSLFEFFCCEWCGVRYQSISQLETHIPCNMSHEACNRFGCGRCHASFTTLMSLWNHVFDCHLTKLFACDKCDETFDKTAICADHLLTHANKNSCERCGRSFKSALQLTRHQYSVCRAKHGNKDKSRPTKGQIKAPNAWAESYSFKCSSTKKLFCADNNAENFREHQDFEAFISPNDKSPAHLKMRDCVSDNDLYSEEDGSDEEWSLENWKQELKRNNRIKRLRKVPREVRVDPSAKSSAVDRKRAESDTKPKRH